MTSPVPAAFSDELTPPAAKTGPDSRPKRPTTRAGRRAAAEAKRAERLVNRDKPPAAKKPAPRRPSLEARLQGLIATIGLGLAAVGPVMNPAYGQDGQAIIAHSPNVAKALSKWADENPAVRQALEMVLTGGAIGGVLFALLPLAAEIAANHGALPSGVPGMFAAFGAPTAAPADNEDQAVNEVPTIVTPHAPDGGNPPMAMPVP
jgi:hypothetical protein